MGYRTTKSKIKAGSNKAKTFDSINATANISYTAFFYHAFRNVLIISIPLVIISAIILSSLYISATDSASSTDTLSFNISSSCTLSSVVDSSHTAELINGTYTNSIGQTTITTLCNDGNGYSVYAVGYSNNEEGNNKLVNTESSNFSIISGTAESGNTSNWAMSLNHLVDDPSLTPPIITSDYDSIYGIVPNEWTKVASLPARATDMIKGSSFTTTYAVYTSSSQYAGTYNGQVKYMLVHPNNNKPTLTNLEAAFASRGIQPAYQDETGSYFAMQDMSTEICDSVSGDGETTATQLVDARDNKLYWVAKLEDGHCWMTSNLDLDIGGTNVATLTSENTDISTTASGSGIYSDGYTEQDGVWTWTPVSTAITSNYYIDNTTVKPSAWPTNNYITPYSAEGGDTYYYTSNTTGNDTRYNSLQACKDASHTEDECKRYFVGNYYNWTAAIASNNSTNIGSTVGEIASNSICPKGWRLPNASQTDNVNNEFGRMLYQAEITAKVSAGDDSVGYTTGGFNKLRSNPYYFVRSGSIYGGTLGNPGVYGFYWSSTVSSSTDAYNLFFISTGIYPARNNLRYLGRSVRCVAR